MAYTRKYVPRGQRADRQIVHEPDADDIHAPEYDVDVQLEDLTRKVLRRLHQEIHNYTVPQLLSGLHKCLQVRVLMQTLRLKGGTGNDVGSSVRKYATAFSPDDTGRRAPSRGRKRAAFTDDPDDRIIELVTSDDD